MNEMEALRWFATMVVAGSSAAVVAAWTVLFFLRKKIRHDRSERLNRVANSRGENFVGAARN